MEYIFLGVGGWLNIREKGLLGMMASLCVGLQDQLPEFLLLHLGQFGFVGFGYGAHSCGGVAKKPERDVIQLP